MENINETLKNEKGCKRAGWVKVEEGKGQQIQRSGREVYAPAAV